MVITNDMRFKHFIFGTYFLGYIKKWGFFLEFPIRIRIFALRECFPAKAVYFSHKSFYGYLAVPCTAIVFNYVLILIKLVSFRRNLNKSSGESKEIINLIYFNTFFSSEVMVIASNRLVEFRTAIS